MGRTVDIPRHLPARRPNPLPSRLPNVLFWIAGIAVALLVCVAAVEWIVG